MKSLLVGFDSAWTSKNSGALAGVVRYHDGSHKELGPPQVVNFNQAEEVILGWQDLEKTASTVVMIDQPTIVRNSKGQRPVENIVASPVSRRRGGMQPANTGRIGMFDCGAPIWGFLKRFGGQLDPLEPVSGTTICETYPVLAIIALGWTMPDTRPSGRLPKYNPERKKNFSTGDWKFVCLKLLEEIKKRNLSESASWINTVKMKKEPNKRDQDRLDAIICLLCALYFSERKECLLVGNSDTGLILVPACYELRKELKTRCEKTGRNAAEWVRLCAMKTTIE